MKFLKGMLLFMLCFAVLTGCGKNNNTGDNQDLAQDTSADTGDTAVTPTVTVTPTAESDAAAQVTPQDKIDINIAVLKGPTAIGMVQVMDLADLGKSANNYHFTVSGTADEISAGLAKGDIDIAAVPCNLASVLYNKKQGKIKLAGINTLGVLYIMETGDTIHSVEDLKGKTIYSTGLGTTPQFTLNYLLSAYGIDPQKDVTIEYKTEPTEVATLLSKSDNAIAMLPQPYVTTVMMNNTKARIALDVAAEWDKVSKDGSGVVTGVLVARDEFLQNNKAAFDAFMEEYSASTDFVNANIDEASALVEKFDIFKAAIAKQAIPYCNITLIRGEDMKTKVNGYLTALFNQNPQAVGGKLPYDNFYYMP
jgi:NitT/TauT family transport system substrate-binding protein